MYLGIDLGTSAVKFVVTDARQAIRASFSVPVVTASPRPGWSEQDPQAWLDAVFAGLDSLAASHGDLMGGIRGIGLSGQMHAALLLDAHDRPVRPAVLWNDQRADGEAAELARTHPEISRMVGVLPMPGFTGPKLLWLRRNEPDVLAGARRLLFPKDYVRLALTGERATDVSEAAGSWLLDQAARAWSPRALEACGAENLALPPILASHAVAGCVRPELARRWGMADVAVVAGAGDAPAGCVGVGVVKAGQGLVSLGTSAQVMVVAAAYAPEIDRLVHAFCHAVPKTWYNMAALLNGASALSHVARWTGYDDVGCMLREVEAAQEGPGTILALPYLVGERTPHNDATARAAFVGMAPTTERRHLALAMMEAVTFSLRDGLEALAASVPVPPSLTLVGGGSASPFWAQMMATVLERDLEVCDASSRGPAFGAARLAMIGASGEAPEAVIRTPPVVARFSPDRTLGEAYRERLALFRSLYGALAPEFRKRAALDTAPAR